MIGGASPPNAPLFVVRDLVTGIDSPFTPVDRLVALCVAHHMNLEGEAWPSLQRICDWTALGLTSVRTSLDRLCEGEGRVFDRERGGARTHDRYARSRYRVSNKPVAPRGAREARASAGEREGIASRARAYRHATTNGPMKVSVNESTPPTPLLPQGEVALATNGRELNAACRRVHDSLVTVGWRSTRKTRTELRDALRSGTPEAEVLEAFMGEFTAAIASRQRAADACTWVEGQGGVAVVVSWALTWLDEHQLEGENAYAALRRWSVSEAGAPPETVWPFLSSALKAPLVKRKPGGRSNA